MSAFSLGQYSCGCTRADERTPGRGNDTGDNDTDRNGVQGSRAIACLSPLKQCSLSHRAERWPETAVPFKAEQRFDPAGGPHDLMHIETINGLACIHKCRQVLRADLDSRRLQTRYATDCGDLLLGVLVTSAPGQLLVRPESP